MTLICMTRTITSRVYVGHHHRAVATLSKNIYLQMFSKLEGPTNLEIYPMLN